MTTVWLLLLMVLTASSHIVNSQSTTGDETCSDEGVLSELQRDMKRLQQLVQQHQRILDNLQQILQPQQTTTPKQPPTTTEPAGTLEEN